MPRRRALNWRKIGLLLASAAAASFAAAVLFLDWNPWPVVGAIMASGLVLNFGPGAWDKVKQACDMSPKTPEQWARQTFGCDDPILAVKALKLDEIYVDTKLRGLRRYFVPVDGSDKDGTMNRVNPVLLPYWMRYSLLPDFVGLNVGGKVCWDFWPSPWFNAHKGWAEPGGYTRAGAAFTYYPRGEAPDVRAWTRAYPLIKALLNVEVCFEYAADRGTVSIKIAEGGDPPGGFVNAIPEPPPPPVPLGPEPLPYEPLPMKLVPNPAGHLHDGWLYFGEHFLDRKAGGHWLKIADLTHVLVMGTSGFGKSVFLNQMLEGVHHNTAAFDRVYLVDLKGGVELWPYQARGERYRVVHTLEHLPDLVAELVELVQARLSDMRERGLRMWDGPKTLFVVDEYADIQQASEATKEDREVKQRMLKGLNRLSMLGRAAGLLIWAQLQKGTSDVMDSSFRANLATQVCFKVPNKLTAAGMFGTTDELLVDPVKLPKGRFVLYDASKGETYYLQARVLQ